MPNKVFTGPNGIRSGWRLLLFIVLTGIAFAVVEVLLTVGGFRPNFSHGLQSFDVIVSDGVTFLCPLLAAWVMSHIEHKSLRDYGLPARGAFGVSFWLGAFIGYIAISLLLIGIRIGHGFYFGNLALSARGVFYYGTMWALAFLIVGLAEEFLFRGYALATLTEGIGFWPAAIVLSAAFGALHLSNHGEDWAGALSAGLVGLLFCFSFRRSGSLWFAIGLHAAWDYSESFLYSVPDSGTLARGHLLNSVFPKGAPTWLTGGAVGPEGSVLVFVVLAVLFVVVDRMYPEVRFPARKEKTETGPPEPEAVSN